MLMTNPTEKLVNVNMANGKGFYTVYPGASREIGDECVRAAKAHGLVEAKTVSPKKTEPPTKREVKKKEAEASSSSFFDVTIDNEMEAKMYLQSNATTVIGDLKEIERISKPDLRKLHDYEKLHRNRRQVIKYLEGRMR